MGDVLEEELVDEEQLVPREAELERSRGSVSVDLGVGLTVKLGAFLEDPRDRTGVHLLEDGDGKGRKVKRVDDRDGAEKVADVGDVLLGPLIRIGQKVVVLFLAEGLDLGVLASSSEEETVKVGIALEHFDRDVDLALGEAQHEAREELGKNLEHHVGLKVVMASGADDTERAREEMQTLWGMVLVDLEGQQVGEGLLVVDTRVVRSEENNS